MKLLGERRFGPLFLTQFLGAFNDNFFKNALIILIVFRDLHIFGIPPAQMVAAAGGVFILPFFLFSATAGQLADKYEKAQLIRFTKLLEVAIAGVAVFGFVFEHHSFLFFCLFLLGVQATLFGPLKYSILPQHLGEKDLVGGNALIEAGTFLAILLGTIAGGILISIPESGPKWVAAGLLVIALAGYFSAWQVPVAESTDPKLKIDWNPVRPTVTIWKHMSKNRPVFLSALGISWFWFFGACMLSIFPNWCKDLLQADESVVTLFLAIFSVGIGIGSLLCEKLSVHRLELGLVPFGSIGLSVFTAWLATSGKLPFDGLGEGGRMTAVQYLTTPHGLLDISKLLLLSVFGGFYTVPLYTLIQERSEPAYRSRIIAGLNIINSGFMVAAAIMLMAMNALGYTLVSTFILLALLNIGVGFYIYSLLPEFLYRFGVWVLGSMMYRIRVVGRENIPTTGGAFIIANHVSFVDWLLLASATNRPIRWVMDYSYVFKPFRYFFRKYKVIPVAAKSEDPSILVKAYEQIAFEIKDGEMVGIFPEGAITRDGKLSPFKRGIEKMLAATPAPVVPIAIHGMWGSFFSRKDGPAGQKVPKRFWSRVTLEIGPAIPPEQATAEHLQGVLESMLKSGPKLPRTPV